MRSHSWQCISEQQPSHEVEGTVCRAQKQDCVEAQIWGRLQKNSAALKVPKSTVASIILKWKKFGGTRAPPRSGCLAQLSNQGRRALVREVTKNLIVTLAELQRSCVEMGETSTRSTITAEDFVWSHSPDLWLDTILFLSSEAVLSTPWLGFCSDVHCQLWDLIWTGVCLSKSCRINWIYLIKV